MDAVTVPQLVRNNVHTGIAITFMTHWWISVTNPVLGHTAGQVGSLTGLRVGIMVRVPGHTLNVSHRVGHGHFSVMGPTATGWPLRLAGNAKAAALHVDFCEQFLIILH